MTATTLKIHQHTKAELDTFREQKSETYDEVITKLMFIAKNIETNPELSQETIKAITRARKRIASGHFVTESEAKKRLGL